MTIMKDILNAIKNSKDIHSVIQDIVKQAFENGSTASRAQLINDLHTVDLSISTLISCAIFSVVASNSGNSRPENVNTFFITGTIARDSMNNDNTNAAADENAFEMNNDNEAENDNVLVIDPNNDNDAIGKILSNSGSGRIIQLISPQDVNDNQNNNNGILLNGDGTHNSHYLLNEAMVAFLNSVQEADNNLLNNHDIHQNIEEINQFPDDMNDNNENDNNNDHSYNNEDDLMMHVIM